jgi:hypothetical protein
MFMKQRLAVFVAVLLASVGVVLSADTSQTYGPLAASAQFQSRVSFLITQEAPVVLTEAQTGSYTAACHTLRASLAAVVARNPQSYAPIFAQHLVTNINVTTAGALTGTLGAGTLDTPATDAALFAAIAAQWSTVAGCISFP